jgi:hypothetical protein
MRAILNHMTVATIAGLMAMGTSSWAAVAPLGPENLRKEATHIITGRVLEVKSRTRKSKVEKTIGIHRDRVFTIRLRVTGVAKGKGVRKGDEIVVTAWRPVLRIPPIPGPQGHSSVPKNGEVVTVHVRSREGATFVPIMPNGIRTESPKPPR